MKGVWGASGEKAINGAPLKKLLDSFFLTGLPPAAILAAAVASGVGPEVALLGLGLGAIAGGLHDARNQNPEERVEQALNEGKSVKAVSKDARKTMKKEFGLKPAKKGFTLG